MIRYTYHPLANLFPLLKGKGLLELAKDIEDNGQSEPIVIYRNQILDGRNRYRACEIAGVEPKTVTYKGKDPIQFVVTKNLYRRHLGTGQRAIIASKIANLRQGEHGGPSAVPLRTAAKLMNVSTASVTKARTVAANPIFEEAVMLGQATLNTAKMVIKEGSPELVLAVETRATTVNDAAASIRNEQLFRSSYGNEQDRPNELYTNLAGVIGTLQECIPESEQDKSLFRTNHKYLAVVTRIIETAEYLRSVIVSLQTEKTDSPTRELVSSK